MAAFSGQVCSDRGVPEIPGMGQIVKETELYERLNRIACDVFDEDGLTLSPATQASDVEGWDSLSHVRFLLTIEKEFRVKFTTSEIGKLSKVADLVALLESKLDQANAAR